VTEEFAIALNRTYLRESLQALNVAPDERIEMRFNDPLLPMQIQPEAADDRFIVLMPMHLYL
jgi:DNA polymerase III sliding clamp (beta) subunit (PCNA family)